MRDLPQVLDWETADQLPEKGKVIAFRPIHGRSVFTIDMSFHGVENPEKLEGRVTILDHKNRGPLVTLDQDEKVNTELLTEGMLKKGSWIIEDRLFKIPEDAVPDNERILTTDSFQYLKGMDLAKQDPDYLYLPRNWCYFAIYTDDFKYPSERRKAIMEYTKKEWMIYKLPIPKGFNVFQFGNWLLNRKTVGPNGHSNLYLYEKGRVETGSLFCSHRHCVSLQWYSTHSQTGSDINRGYSSHLNNVDDPRDIEFGI